LPTYLRTTYLTYLPTYLDTYPMRSLTYLYQVTAGFDPTITRLQLKYYTDIAIESRW